MKAYLDYYKKNNIIPVSQDISNLKKHFGRRTALYMQCGIPPYLIKNKDVLEIGPGTGDNAIFTNYMQPSNYMLIDGNPKSIKSTYEKLSNYFKNISNCDFVEQDILDFNIDKLFDIVLCEGLISHQQKPKKFLKKISRFVKPGGILLITCVDHVSFLSEMLRRVIGTLLVNNKVSINENVKILRNYFHSHLSQLNGMSRRIDDWIYDTILQPFCKTTLLSIEDSIKILYNDFEVYGMSPNFFIDWRWYKQINFDYMFNQLVIEAYKKNIHTFLDYRYEFNFTNNIELNAKLLKKARVIFNICMAVKSKTDNKKIAILL